MEQVISICQPKAAKEGSILFVQFSDFKTIQVLPDVVKIMKSVHFVRHFFAFFQKCEPMSYGKLHICSPFLSSAKRGGNRYGVRPVFSVLILSYQSRVEAYPQR